MVRDRNYFQQVRLNNLKTIQTAVEKCPHGAEEEALVRELFDKNILDPSSSKRYIGELVDMKTIFREEGILFSRAAWRNSGSDRKEEEKKPLEQPEEEE